MAVSTLYAAEQLVLETLPTLSVVLTHTLWALALVPKAIVNVLLLNVAVVLGVQLLSVVIQYLLLETPLWLSDKVVLILKALYHPLLPLVLEATLKLWLGFVLSTFTTVVLSSEIFPTLSITRKRIVSFLVAVYVIVPVFCDVAKALVVQAPFSYHSKWSIPEPSSSLVKVIGKSLPVQVFSFELLILGLLGAVLSILMSTLFSSEIFPAWSLIR